MDSAANAFLGKCRNLKSGDINLKQEILGQITFWFKKFESVYITV